MGKAQPPTLPEIPGMTPAVKSEEKPAVTPKDTAPATKPPEELDRENVKPSAASKESKASKEIPATLKAQGFEPRPWVEKKPEGATGNRFWLKVIPSDDRGNTHLAKNETHTWMGTAEQFKACFERE